MIPLHKVFMPGDIIDQIEKILYSGQLTYGRYTEEFEKKLIDFIGNPLLITTSNNNNALQVALSIIDIYKGDEIIASPMSCLATNQPIITSGAKVVWADIDPCTGTLDPDEVKKKITRNTKAIIHYHWCGYPGYIDEINSLAKQYDIRVIEDATEAFGAEYKGKKIGSTNSDIVCFSFQPVRIPNTIDGGAISFNNKNLYLKAVLAQDYGIDRKRFRDKLGEINKNCDIAIKGYNAKMNEFSGYIGIKQMENVKHLLSIQRDNADFFNSHFRDSNLKCLEISNREILPSFWVYTLLIEDIDTYLKYCREHGIYTSKVHLRNDYYSCFGAGLCEDLKGVDYFSRRELCIPSGWWVRAEDREYISETIRKAI